mmetsp:Transcript_139917/g.390011  ORF Transcript_139917/g.390011 Transcript_139917/m.390011 type:complete len:809 (-) Transcript_139917:162-2588(-)
MAQGLGIGEIHENEQAPNRPMAAQQPSPGPTEEVKMGAPTVAGSMLLDKASAMLGRVNQAVAALQGSAGGGGTSNTGCRRCVFCGQPVARAGEWAPVAAEANSPGVGSPECRSCLTEAERDSLVMAQKRLHALVAAFFQTGMEEVHVEPEETRSQMALRLGVVTLSGLGQMLWLVPGVAGAAQTVNVAEGLLRFGPLAAYYQEMREALSLLVLLSQQVKSQTPSMRPMDMAELVIGAYYLLLEHGNARGLDPLRAQREHADCPQVRPEELCELAELLPLASPIAYAATAAEAQRQLALLPGEWRLVLREDAGPGGQPGFAVAVSGGGSGCDGAAVPRQRRAAVLVPGTQTPGDLVTDLRAEPTRVRLGPKETGWAHQGMLRAAFALVRLLGTVVEALEREGYQVLFLGHSLGGAIAALAALLLRLGEEGMPRSAGVRAVCYAMPACGDVRLGRFCEAFVTSVINCDDIVPRLSFDTVQSLHAELEGRREEFWAFAHQDFEALRDVKSLVELKRRGSRKSNLEPPPAGDVEDVRQDALPEPPSPEAPAEAPAAITKEVPAPASAAAFGGSALQRFLEYLSCGVAKQTAAEEIRVAVPEEPLASSTGMDDDCLEALSLCEVKLHPPGRLVHLYRHCGTRRGAWVRRAHPALQRIEVEVGLLQDHCGEAYKDALDGALASAAGAKPPPWKPFAEVSRCGCCGEAFGWDSVLRSEPHRLQARHHCHACGGVVCTSCCQRRRHLPQLGVAGEARVCDRCFLLPAGALAAAAAAAAAAEGNSGPDADSPGAAQPPASLERLMTDIIAGIGKTVS